MYLPFHQSATLCRWKRRARPLLGPVDAPAIRAGTSVSVALVASFASFARPIRRRTRARRWCSVVSARRPLNAIEWPERTFRPISYLGSVRSFATDPFPRVSDTSNLRPDGWTIALRSEVPLNGMPLADTVIRRTHLRLDKPWVRGRWSEARIQQL